MQEIKDKRLGWKKDKYNPYAKYRKMGFVVAIPDVGPTDMVSHTPAVRTQEASDCTGFGIGGKITAAANKLGITLTGGTQFVSPTDVYNGGRYINGDLQYDDGAYPDDCYNWLTQKSCLPEGYWKYMGFEKRSRPSSLDQYTTQYPLLKVDVLRIDNGVDGICAALGNGEYVSLGIPWPDIWMSSKDGMLPTPKSNSSLAGGHEFYVYNYNRTLRLFYCVNSWGIKNWSYLGSKVPKGHFTITFDSFPYFKNQGGWDAHTARIRWVTQPTPPEPPEPTPDTGKYEIAGIVSLIRTSG